MKFSDAKLRALKSEAKPYKIFDGGGLYIEVSTTGAKLWRLKYRHGGVEKRLAFGAYPDVTLARARSLRDEARQQLAEGHDPGALRKIEKLRSTNGTTFEAIANEWLKEFGDQYTESTRIRTRARLTRFVFPHVGKIEMSALRTMDLLTMLQPIKTEGKRETAHRVHQLCGQICRYAVSTGRAEHDVSTAIRGSIPAPIVRHMPAIIDPNEVGPLLRAIDDYDGGSTVRAALQLSALFFVRPGEIRQAEWREFDIAKAQWNIPGERMKMRKDHLVPLATQAIAILDDLRELTGHGRFLFPSLRTGERPISDGTVSAALRRMGYGGDVMTPHGFRAMARTILDEVLGFPEAVIEQQLAHAVSGPLGSAYNRTKHLPERKMMMQRWAEYLDERRASNVIPFPTKVA